MAGQTATIVFDKPSGERRTAQMVKRVVNYPTVSVSRLFEVDGRKVGYIVFNTFVQPSTAALNDAFAALKTAGATELVLDLRYNGGGLVDVAVHLGSLIGGAVTNGQPMLNYVHNDKIGPAANKTTRFTNPSDALNLQRLVVIATRSTASASELVINALRPFMPVTIVGDATYGKPVGSYGLRFCDKVLWPISFSIKNANLEGDYFAGLPADCPAADDSTHQLGDAAEVVARRSPHGHPHRLLHTAQRRRIARTEIAAVDAAVVGVGFARQRPVGRRFTPMKRRRPRA